MNKTQKISALVNFAKQQPSTLAVILQKTGFRNDQIVEIPFQHLEHGYHALDPFEKNINFFHTSDKLRQTIFDCTQTQEGFLIGFDLQGRRTAKQYVPGTSTATFLQAMHQPFVLFVPVAMMPMPDFDFLLFFDGPLILTGARRMKIIHHAHVFQVAQLEHHFHSMKNLAEKFGIRFTTDGSLALLFCMGDHFDQFEEFYAVLHSLGLQLGKDYFYCLDEFPDPGKTQALSTLLDHPWIASELSESGSFVWLKE